MNKANYNKEAQSMYIKVSDIPSSFGIVAHTEELVADNVLVDYLASGEVYGIEIVNVALIQEAFRSSAWGLAASMRERARQSEKPIEGERVRQYEKPKGFERAIRQEAALRERRIMRRDNGKGFETCRSVSKVWQSFDDTRRAIW